MATQQSLLEFSISSAAFQIGGEEASVAQKPLTTGQPQGKEVIILIDAPT